MPTLVTGRRDCGKEGKRQDRRGFLLGVLKMVWFSLAFCLVYVLRVLWVSDRKTVISGGDGVELWPRKLATAKFLIEDMKNVKRAVSSAIYSRTPNPGPAFIEKYKAYLANFGYDPSKIKDTPQDCEVMSNSKLAAMMSMSGMQKALTNEFP